MLFQYEGREILCGVLDVIDLGLLAKAAAQGTLAGASGLVLPHEIVTGYHHNVRGRMGSLLQLLPKVWVMDDLSLEWLPHLGLAEGSKGPDVNWLRVDAIGIRQFKSKDKNETGAYVVKNLEDAYTCALRGVPFVLLVEHASRERWGGMDTSYLPLYRWAREYNMLDAIAPDREAAETTYEGYVYPRELAQQALELAKKEFAPTTSANLTDKLDDLFGEPKEAQAPEAAGFRKLDYGTEFDPSKHYDDYYYGVDGKGILYPRPDGSWQIYRGTAHVWVGNKAIAKWVKQLSAPKRHKLLDVGTGAGHFVACARAVGFAASGVDISAEAKKHAPPYVRELLQVADVSKERLRGGPYDIITAWDFWEHIFYDDLARLAQGVYANLVDSGLHFACICTRGDGERDYTMKFGEKVTGDNAWVLVSGHVTIRNWNWWARFFKEVGFRLRYDLMDLFQVMRASDPGMRTCESWSARNVLVLGK